MRTRHPARSRPAPQDLRGRTTGFRVPVRRTEQEDGSTLSVADSDESYPLQMKNQGDSTGTLTFGRFGEKEDISAPEDALDLAEAMGGA